MSRHDDSIFIRHMLDYSTEAIMLVQDKTREALDQERLLNLALVRLVEIVGEAANRVSVQTQAKYPSVPWPQIIGLRNRLVHGYDEVDFDVLWRIVREDLPPLAAELRKILGENKTDGK